MLCLRPGAMCPSIRPCCFCGLPLAMAALPATQGQKGMWGDSMQELPSCNQVHWHPGQWSGQAVPGGLWVTGSCLTASQMQRLALSSGHPGRGSSGVPLGYWRWHCWLGVGRKHGAIPR